MGRPFDHVLRLPGAQLEGRALAIAAEFAPVDFAAAHERLDWLAAPVGAVARLPALERAERLVAELAGRRGYAYDLTPSPDSLLLDSVIDRRRGHPIALVILYAAVARRAGFVLLPVGCGRRAILADPSIAPTIVFDPAGVMSRPPSEPAWLCPHVTSAMLLEALAVRYLERGELGEAIRALELADELPLVRQRRERVSARLHALRSRLN